MAWIESHQDIGEHPKLKELCFQLAIKPYQAIGHLHLLWHFTLKYAWRDGDLRRFSARVICEAVGWDNDADTFINALRDTGWLEKDSLVIHDWLDYSGKLVRDRLYQESRRLTAIKNDKKRLVDATLPNPTLPNLKTKTTPYSPPKGDDTRFETFWKTYPRKIGKGAAEKAWKKISSIEAIFEKIVAAVAAQSKTDQWLKDGGQFIPHPATWLNQRRWEDEVPKGGTCGRPRDIYDRIIG